MALCTASAVQAQITIGGNVYGGGNEGDLTGGTEVVVCAGDIQGNVYGGARQANVGGSTFVNIDGEHMSGDILINCVYGGNDIAGTIGTSNALPTHLKQAATNGIDKTYNAFVMSTKERTVTTVENEQTITTQPYKIYLGQLFGGGNGDYDYTSDNSPYKGMTRPELGKTYLEILGGSCVLLYGGGNNVTVTEATDICIDNPSAITYHIYERDANGNEILSKPKLTDARLKAMGVYQLGGAGEDVANSPDYQFSRVFGGNNKAPMAIRPTWHLKRGIIRNLFSGGNQGAMTHENGIVMTIESENVEVKNVYGGCRMADVNPARNNIHSETINGIYYPGGYAARLYITAGNITNVYGGNDISGTVYGGNVVGIHCDIHGDVYGGGNGSYPYTDNAKFKRTKENADQEPVILYGDFYYNPDEVLTNAGLSVPSDPGMKSAKALTEFRPHAESVSIYISGTDENHPVIVEGAVYCGGNSATLRSSSTTSTAELKIGSYAWIEDMFLGSNGANMITEDVLKRLAQSVTVDEENYDFSQMDLTKAAQFEEYMKGCEMDVKPDVLFVNTERDDPTNYEEYTSYFGSFYCGGNVGSVRTNGLNNITFNHKVIIFEKLVGGSNKANVPATQYNAAYNGGLLGDPDTNGNKLQFNLSGLKLQPKRWKDETNKHLGLEWNIFQGDAKDITDVSTLALGKSSANDLSRRLKGACVYGGCYESGHVEGNVVINLNGTLVDVDGTYGVFDSVEEDANGEPVVDANGKYTITARRSGVINLEQGLDERSVACNVFGGGYGENSEIWGSTTINLNEGYAFQVYGGGEKGIVGKKNSEGNYVYDADYSTTINLHGERPGQVGHFDDLVECEYVYGGGLEGLVCGDTHVNLGNCRVFQSFGGACIADILGHTETHIGRAGLGTDGNPILGFPYIRDNIYGGNDLGGHILGKANFADYVLPATRSMIHSTDVLEASAYVGFFQGRIVNIFGGCYGNYDYSGDAYYKTVKKPFLDNAFVNITPRNHADNEIKNYIFGAGLGHDGERDGDKMQNRSYILINIPDELENFKRLQVFGAGSYDGLGMGVTKSVADDPATADKASAIIDLLHGQIDAVYGASFNEGITRRAIVNIPAGSTIKLNNIFGGAYGLSNDKPCDAYEAHVNWSSNAAQVKNAIYGGNNNARRTLYSFVNINNTVYSDKDKNYQATIYGAGYGENTWSQYTEVNLNRNAVVNEVYGGGNAGKVLNKESVTAWKATDSSLYTSLPDGYTDNGLNTSLVTANSLGSRTNTNVNIHRDATVTGYCYGGGLGETATVSGTTFIGLLGGKVVKDLYAGGTSGAVMNAYEAKNATTFTAKTNAYILGGSVRNVYGGGWKGSVGKHVGAISADPSTDIDGETNVVIGIRQEQAGNFADFGFYCGVPTIERNVYSGGEGGAVFGTANLTINNGYIGYVYHPGWQDDPATEWNEHYEEKLHDETWTDHVGHNRLVGSGNAFGGGYIDNSSVDYTNIKMYGGFIRNSVFGGGEIAAIGRGTVTASGYENSERTLDRIYKYGKTHIEIYHGHVMRDVYGGGKGYNNLGETGSLYTDGYVFGQTEVFIRGGEIGTPENYEEGYGNVFGGGDIGYVYGIGKKSTLSTDSPGRYYYTTTGANDAPWTEDCKVVVEPYAQVLSPSGVTIDGTSYNQYDYVPTDKLNKLKGKTDVTDGPKWAALDDRGVIIRNAVFAGGNVAVGSDKVYANTVTVFGNATAALRDIYRRDLITIGTEHIGGLYGGGNLSLVDGYRELHVSNYGTDYYGLKQSIEMDEYNSLTDRERAYFRLRFTCKRAFDGGKDEEGITYAGHQVGDQIYEDEYNDLPDLYKTVGEKDVDDGTYWYQDGFCSIYAGRLLNTIQRADFVGVFGSRMVLQGARDRVTSVLDYNRYTINRVGELTLMKVNSPAGETDDTNKRHGNYFGIYSTVHYLGNLTSDVRMDDVRTSNTSDTDDHTTYYQWKAANPNSRKRNTATCHNEVALASGVFLELTTEKSTAEHKDFGYITGIIELDLMNAKADEVGGGYVYAKNEHGTREEVDYQMVTLSDYNDDARSYKMYTYRHTTASDLQQIQTSGNFIHDSKKIIIDDCYPHNLEYTPGTEKYSEAHYWFVKGSIYIYDQVISAYTGSPTAYTREQIIPLTITANSNGKLKLIDVKPNLYAYYENFNAKTVIGEDGIKVGSNSTTYMLNDVISYWDWSQLNEAEKNLFVPETMVSVAECSYLVGETVTSKAEGTVMLPADYTTFKNSLPTKVIDGKNVHYVHDVKKNIDVDVDDIFHPSNNVSHNTGYVVNFKMDTPPDWNDWYTPKTGAATKISTASYEALSDAEKANYKFGPTYQTSEAGVYGQRLYDEGEIIPKATVDAYTDPGTDDQAPVSRAYITKESVTYTYNGQIKTVNPGTAISETEYTALQTQAPAAYAKFKAAKMCIGTLELNEENYIIYGDLLNDDMVNDLAAAFDGVTANDINRVLTEAYICEAKGLYGGTSYETGVNYSALEGWAALTSADRAKNKFTFNGDGFDILSDPYYQGEPTRYGHPYDQAQSVEYTAVYNSDSPITGTIYGDISKGRTLTRLEYEALTNEKSHYTPVTVTTTAADGDDYYIAKVAFSRGNMAYAKGQVINSGTYRALSAQERNDWVTVIRFTNRSSDDKTYYYCREDYTGSTSVINREKEGEVLDATENGSGTSVQEGWVIDADDYGNLINQQRGFLIKGDEPTEQTTLYVSRESNIHDLTKEKIITVIYQYTYNEGDESGESVSLMNELHIVNIHLKFESGAPIIDQLLPPSTVLPGTTVGMNQPKVTPGAYELIGGGWEIYDNPTDAEFHRNGVTYRNNETPMYWYQDGYYVAYYAKSYVGKTYSNPVQFSVANYHDLKKVMDATDHHYYIDRDDVKREPKIYINDYSTDGVNGLDLLADLFNLSHGTELTGHEPLNDYVKDCENLEIFMHANIDHSGSTWTPIANNANECFGGTLHGDGYTISGLDHSLFNHLCGDVYNLGVTGSFTGAGIAETGSGYMENCWIWTTGTPVSGVKAVFGNPSRGEGTQLVNCYYPAGNAYSETSHPRGNATKMPEKSFYNGEVTYDLNGFYLKDRYDRNRTSGEAINDPYVRTRFSDGDFVYANGTIPDDMDERYSETSGTYTPIWPDDYLFFGQALNYNHLEDLAYQQLPSHIIKEGNLVKTSAEGNRVLRAPAYYRSSAMKTAYFNPYAVFAQSKKNEPAIEAYKDMTAIDFTGSNTNNDGVFYPPLLDDCGLTGLVNVDLTKNLLVYTPAEGQTASVVGNYLQEEAYAETNATYRTVGLQDNLRVHGHWVKKVGNSFIAPLDHSLVDKQDFNAPISYTFADDRRMWYQRTPEVFADQENGWEGVCLPFTVELVTTQQKGEITHFSQNSIKGHEYWLREFGDIDATSDPAVADFPFPAESNSDPAKTVENTFLWDYYYESVVGHNHQDMNNEVYQTYYNQARTYEHYPRMKNGTPYIIGFPGALYNEFDLSGTFLPTTTALPAPEKLNKQYVTFVSEEGATIGVSDSEMTGAEQTHGNNKYTFKPNYLNRQLATGEGYYTMSAEGNKFNSVSSSPIELSAFRPYFHQTSGSQARRAIVFSMEQSEMYGEEPNDDIDDPGRLLISVRNKHIIVSSTLPSATPVVIVNAAGQTIATFTIESGETIERRVNTGVYIVNKKKVIVR